MTLIGRLWAWLKTTHIGKFCHMIFLFCYIRWRVFRAVSTDPDDDSLGSSLYDTGRPRVIRSTSMYPESCPSSLRDRAACQKPRCIELFHQFMNYGAVDQTIPGHIFLSNSISYYANSETELCQLSAEESGEWDEESLLSWSQEIVHDSDLASEVASEASENPEEADLDDESVEDTAEDEEEDAAFENYARWMNGDVTFKEPKVGTEVQLEVLPEPLPEEPKKVRRLLPKTPDEYYPEGEPVNIHVNPFAHLQYQAERGAEVMTYPETQRQVRNYFFTQPMYFESDELRQKEEQRLDELERQRRKKRVALQDMESHVLYDNSSARCSTSQIAESFGFGESFTLHDLRNDWKDSYSTYSDLASTVIPDPDGSQSSEYQTASLSSPQGKEISDRFSDKYWSVNDNCGDGAIGARDNYHNRFFGKAGYHFTRNAIENRAHGRDAMPAVEKRALVRERRVWDEILKRGRRYDNVDLSIPDTNGINTNGWEDQYEVPLPSYTSDTWRTAKFMKMPSQNPALFQCEQKCLRSAHSPVGGAVVKVVAVGVVLVGVALVVVVETGGAGERDLMTALKVCGLIIERVNEPSHSGGFDG